MKPAIKNSSILDAIGKTPLVRLEKIEVPGGGTIYGKLEFYNPGGSLKDRTAMGLVQDAELKGLIHPDTTLVEATSGNLGVGLALIAARKGLRLKLVMSEKNRGLKSELAAAMGAEITFVKEDIPWDSEHGPLGVALRIGSSTPDALYLNQFNNPANVRIHYETMGAELAEELGGHADVLVAGIGTGGTISGAGARLREENPDVTVYGVAAVGSVFDDQHEKEGYIEGIGSDFMPGTYNADVVQKVFIVDPDLAAKHAMMLLSLEGITAGHSSGAVLAACLKIGARHPGANIVAVFADTMRNYDYWRLTARQSETAGRGRR